MPKRSSFPLKKKESQVKLNIIKRFLILTLRRVTKKIKDYQEKNM